MQNQQISEIKTVELWLDKLQLKGVCFSLDALHSQKTLPQIMSSGNDYVIAVKGNQPNLLAYLKTQFEQIAPLSLDIQIEQCRDRYTQWTVSVLDTMIGIESNSVGRPRIVRVERAGTRAKQPGGETMFDISSLAIDAASFAQLIRSHAAN